MDDPAPGELEETLLDTLLPRLPAGIARLDALLDLANVRGGRLYESHGFRRVRTVHVYVADRAGHSPRMPDAVAPLDASRLDAFAALHDAIFAEGGVPGRLIAARLHERHRVFVAPTPLGRDPAGVLGYVEVSAEPEGEGFIDHLGVAPEARGRRIGETLLRAALAWCFGERGAGQVGLTVDDERANARRLYERAGFRLESSGVNWRREGPSR